MDCILDPLLLEEFHRNCPNCPAPRGRFCPRRRVRASGAAPEGGSNVRESQSLQSPQSLQSSAPTFTRSQSPASNQAPLYLHTLHTPSSSGLPFTYLNQARPRFTYLCVSLSQTLQFLHLSCCPALPGFMQEITVTVTAS